MADPITDTATIDGVARRVAQLAVELLPREQVIHAILKGALVALEEIESQPHPHDAQTFHTDNSGAHPVLRPDPPAGTSGSDPTSLGPAPDDRRDTNI